MTPACVIVQPSVDGGVNVLREFVCERGGLRQFVTDQVRPSLNADFAGMRVMSFGDPAGAQASQVDEATCFGELARLGIPTEPAVTQDIVQRRDAVNFWLTRTTEKGPAFRLDPSCTLLREGFNGGYHFAKVRTALGVEDRYRDVPEKNLHSHVHDALQYVMLALTRRYDAPADIRGRALFEERGGWEGSI